MPLWSAVEFCFKNLTFSSFNVPALVATPVPHRRHPPARCCREPTWSRKSNFNLYLWILPCRVSQGHFLLKIYFFFWQESLPLKISFLIKKNTNIWNLSKLGLGLFFFRKANLSTSLLLLLFCDKVNFSGRNQSGIMVSIWVHLISYAHE